MMLRYLGLARGFFNNFHKKLDCLYCLPITAVYQSFFPEMDENVPVAQVFVSAYL